MPGNGRKVSLYLSEKGGTVRPVIMEGHDSGYFYPAADEAVKAALFRPLTRLSILEAIRAGNSK